MDYWMWIDKHYPDAKSAKNKCNEASRAMANQFPTLSVEYGFLHGVMHCWCRDDFGTIIDPTQRQFEKPTCENDYIFVSVSRLRKDQVDPTNCIAFLDDGRVIVGR